MGLFDFFHGSGSKMPKLKKPKCNCFGCRATELSKSTGMSYGYQPCSNDNSPPPPPLPPEKPSCRRITENGKPPPPNPPGIRLVKDGKQNNGKCILCGRGGE